MLNCCWLGLLKIVKSMLILDQVRLILGQLCQAGLGKGLEEGPCRLRAPHRDKKIPPKLIFNNPRSSILPL